ncbi:sulfatase-like hydrolase/transferase [Rhodohalobacter sp. 8-1]|uniref:sulfatase-like hydrolase/transferase n=1 Tax=Rhodohalobacter sp. 8-1 TaxID=3131972 RepID=UPI0030EC3760
MNFIKNAVCQHIKNVALILILGLFLYGCGVPYPETKPDPGPEELPNILWITSEDNSPFIGAYGDDYAVTPNLDRLADAGTVYENSYATTPVCAPSRFTLITGAYANRMGTENMRSVYPIPDNIRFYPAYLKDLGYYTTNNVKKDYNTIDQPEVWDESSTKAHYIDRAEGQPFFHIRNLTTTHESRLHDPIDTLIHDPANAPVPPYHPDNETVRRDWAHYYDQMTRMDEQVGEILQELEELGEAENTIIFYYGDHGGALPGAKRFMNQRGLRVPLIIYFPDKYEYLKPEENRSDRLVSFVDFPATLLSLAGIEPPEFMDGEPFLGEHETAPRENIHMYRGRMDERYDLSRAVRDQKFLYVRNYMPQRIYGQYLWYLWKAPTMQVWDEEYQAGNLNEIQSQFFEPKPPEELYLISEDPYSVNNLADDSAYRNDLLRLRQVNSEWVREIKDLGFIPEGILDDVRGDRPLYNAVREDDVPIEEIIETAELASHQPENNIEELVSRLDHSDPSVRFWAAMGMAISGDLASGYKTALLERRDDPSGAVKAAIAEALLEAGETSAAMELIEESLADTDGHVKLRALNLIETLDENLITEEIKTTIRRFVDEFENQEAAAAGYIFRASERLVDKFGL